MEFFACLVLGASVGAFLVASNGITARLIGWWVLGVSVNYLPLALHGMSFLRAGTLDTELAGVDVRAELRHYSLSQLWVAIPFAVALFALAQLRRPPGRVESSTAPQKPHG